MWVVRSRVETEKLWLQWKLKAKEARGRETQEVFRKENLVSHGMGGVERGRRPRLCTGSWEE